MNFQESTTILNACTKKSGSLLKAPDSNRRKGNFGAWCIDLLVFMFAGKGSFVLKCVDCNSFFVTYLWGGRAFFFGLVAYRSIMAVDMRCV